MSNSGAGGAFRHARARSAHPSLVATTSDGRIKPGKDTE
jgi:hypothetical protein